MDNVDLEVPDESAANPAMSHRARSRRFSLTASREELMRQEVEDAYAATPAERMDALIALLDGTYELWTNSGPPTLVAALAQRPPTAPQNGGGAGRLVVGYVLPSTAHEDVGGPADGNVGAPVRRLRRRPNARNWGQSGLHLRDILSFGGLKSVQH